MMGKLQKSPVKMSKEQGQKLLANEFGDGEAFDGSNSVAETLQ
jgi:hypothetical protein